MQLVAAAAQATTNQELRIVKPVANPDDRMASLRAELTRDFIHGDYAATASKAKTYLGQSGDDRGVRYLASKAYFQMRDYANAARELNFVVSGIERRGKIPEEEKLVLLQRSYQNLSDFNANIWVLTKLVTYYPNRTYWHELLTALQRRIDLRSSLSLEVMRLKMATDTMETTTELIQGVQLLVDNGFFIEAKAWMDWGHAKGLLRWDTERQRQLRDETNALAVEQLRVLSQGDQAILQAYGRFRWTPLELGFALMTAGEVSRGVAVLDSSQATAAVTRRGSAGRLLQGQAFYLADQTARAIDVFSSASAEGGAAELCKLWSVLLRRPVSTAAAL